MPTVADLLLLCSLQDSHLLSQTASFSEGKPVFRFPEKMWHLTTQGQNSSSSSLLFCSLIFQKIKYLSSFFIAGKFSAIIYYYCSIFPLFLLFGTPNIRMLALHENIQNVICTWTCFSHYFFPSLVCVVSSCVSSNLVFCMSSLLLNLSTITSTWDPIHFSILDLHLLVYELKFFEKILCPFVYIMILSLHLKKHTNLGKILVYCLQYQAYLSLCFFWMLFLFIISHMFFLLCRSNFSNSSYI